MRVLIDEQMFSMQKRGGITRYFTELMSEFTEMPAVEIVTPYRFTVNEHLAEAFPGQFRRLRKPHRAPSRRVLALLNARYRRAIPEADIVHNTYYWPEHLGHDHAAKRVATVHDMIPELFPGYFPRGNPHQEKRRFVEECDAIVCVSENTKSDLMRIYGSLDKPVVVTYPGVDRSFSSEKSPVSPVPLPYLLFVGSRRGYKNFPVVAKAVATLSQEFPDLRLVCIGGGKFTVAELTMLRGLGIDRATHHYSPPDAELPAFYRHAAAFCFPSRYEGFGLPLVESFAAGCPTVIAETPCLIEIADGAAQVVSPDDHGEWAQAVARLMTDSAQRAVSVEAGRRRAADFTWRKTAETTLAAYREAMGSFGQ